MISQSMVANIVVAVVAEMMTNGIVLILHQLHRHLHRPDVQVAVRVLVKEMLVAVVRLCLCCSSGSSSTFSGHYFVIGIFHFCIRLIPSSSSESTILVVFVSFCLWLLP